MFPVIHCLIAKDSLQHLNITIPFTCHFLAEVLKKQVIEQKKDVCPFSGATSTHLIETSLITLHNNTTCIITVKLTNSLTTENNISAMFLRLEKSQTNGRKLKMQQRWFLWLHGSNINIRYRISLNNSRGRFFLFSHKKGPIIQGKAIISNIASSQEVMP